MGKSKELAEFGSYAQINTATDNVQITGDLTVSGTTITVDATTITVQNSLTFEGITADDFETVLTVTNPTADRTITLPDATGTVALTSQTLDNLSSITTLDADHVFQIDGSNNSDDVVTFRPEVAGQNNAVIELRSFGNGGSQQGIPELRFWRDTNDGNSAAGDTTALIVFEGGDISGQSFRAPYNYISSVIDDVDLINSQRYGHLEIQHRVTNIGGGSIPDGTYTSAEFHYDRIKAPGKLEIGDTNSATFDPSSLTADQTITLPDASGTVLTTGNLTEITNLGVLTGDIVFEGATDDDFETTVTAADPTADRTITLPDATGTVLLQATDNTVTIDVGTAQNTTKLFLTGSDALVQLGDFGSNNGPHGFHFGYDIGSSDGMSILYRTASDAITFEDSSGLSGNRVMSVQQDGNVLFTGDLIFEGATADDFETTLTVNDPTADRTITLPDATGNVITTGNLTEITNLGVLTGGITFEGATADDFETTLAVTDPTADRTITLPDTTGNLAVQTTDGYLQVEDSASLQGSVGLNLNAPNSTGGRTRLAIGPAFDVNFDRWQIAVNPDAAAASSSLYLTVNGDSYMRLGPASPPDSTERVVFYRPLYFDDAVGNTIFAAEGAGDNTNEVFFNVTNPTADRTITLPDATGTVALLESTQDFTASQTFSSDLVVGSVLKVEGSIWEEYIVGTVTTNTLTVDILGSANTTQTVSGLSANFEVAFTNAPTSGTYTIGVALIITQGASAYIPNTCTVNGTSVTIKWLNASAPTGNANQTDVVNFTLVNNSGTYDVLAGLSTFG